MVQRIKFLGTKLFENKYFYIDYWSLLHIILFVIIGFYYPNKWGLVIFGSILFEFVENKLSRTTPFLGESMKDTLNDLAFNFIGYWIGMNYGGLILNGIL